MLDDEFFVIRRDFLLCNLIGFRFALVVHAQGNFFKGNSDFCPLLRSKQKAPVQFLKNLSFMTEAPRFGAPEFLKSSLK